MKLDLDLIHRLCQDAEKLPIGQFLDDPTYPEYDQATVLWHAALLVREGALRGAVIGEPTPVAVRITDLTDVGRAILEAKEKASLWEKLKKGLLKPGAGVAIGAVVKWILEQAGAGL
jgi:hypothetical protein